GRAYEDVAHVLGRKHRGPGAELLLLGLGELDRNALGPAFRTAVDVLDQAVVQEVLRVETKALGFGVFEARRPQVAQRRLALAAVERGDLPELQAVAFAGAGEIVADPAPHRPHPPLASRLAQLDIV